jgi:hypothetical protein
MPTLAHAVLRNPKRRRLHVLLVRHNFQVVRVPTGTNSADMIQFFPIWHTASVQHPPNAMDTIELACAIFTASDANPPVAITGPTTEPDPTAGVGFKQCLRSQAIFKHGAPELQVSQ